MRRVPKHIFPQGPVLHLRRRRRFTRLLVEQLEDRTMLSVLVVNNGTDAPVSNELSLRQAIVLANADATAGTSDTITFDPAWEAAPSTSPRDNWS